MSSPYRMGGYCIRIAFCALVAIGILTGCERGSREAPYPHESLLSIIAEAKISLRRDPYREPAGRDLEGRNIYRVTLERLDAVDELASENYDDVLSFARAECLERLGRWPAAIAEYGKVMEKGTSLGTTATERRAWVVKIAEASMATTDSLTLSAYTNTLDVRRTEHLRLLEEKPPFPYDSLIRQTVETNLQVKARFLFDNRYLIPRGSEQAIETARKLIEENPKSHRMGENWLLLAGIYESLARDYAQFNTPDSGDFDAALWSSWMDQAREACRKTAEADGDAAKPEGQARLRALDAYAQRVMESSR